MALDSAKVRDGSPPSKRVLLLGASGTIGRATARSLVAAGHEVVCLLRPDGGGVKGAAAEFSGAAVRRADVTDARSLEQAGFAGERFDAVVSCLASRTGAPRDAWAIDHRAQSNALAVAKGQGVSQFILLSAICVQKPLLEFQKAKLAFEADLKESGLTYSIVRPTAFFKSLSGQVARVQAGKPFMVFGDGRLTACKPISDADLGRYIAGCLTAPERRNRILPVGGPGPAITPREQGERLFELLGRKPKFTHVPLTMLDAIIGGLSLGGRVSAGLAAKAELARIGRYYATESMLVLDPATGRYDADATPEFGAETLFDYYARLVSGDATAERGEHAVF